MTLVPTLGIRHVRTGKYDGTETVTVGDKVTTRPRAITECGAAATSTDYSTNTAKVELRDGRANEMCLACCDKLEAAFGWCDLSNLPDHSGSATAEQRQLIHHLSEEAYKNGCSRFCMNGHTIDQLSSRDAAATINGLKADKAKEWKRVAYRPRTFGDTVLNDLVASLPKGVGTRARNAITNQHITTLEQLNATDPYVVFSTKNAGVGVIKTLLDAGVWPGVSLSSATREGVNKRASKIEPDHDEASAKSKMDRAFLLALEAAKNAPTTEGFQKLLQLGRVQKKRVPPKVSRKQVAAIAKMLRLLSVLSDVLDTDQKAVLTKILQRVVRATAKKGGRSDAKEVQ